MSLESVTRISDLVVTNPTGGDPRSDGDDHIRNIKTAIKTVLGFPRCSLVKTTDQAIPSGVETVVTFDSEVFDPQGMHSVVSNTERITVPANEGGYYLILAQVRMEASTVGDHRTLWLFKNGAQTSHGDNQHPPPSVAFSAYLLNLVALLQLSATDYVSLYVLHNAGVNQNVQGFASPYQTKFQAVKILD